MDSSKEHNPQQEQRGYLLTHERDLIVKEVAMAVGQRVAEGTVDLLNEAEPFVFVERRQGRVLFTTYACISLVVQVAILALIL